MVTPYAAYRWAVLPRDIVLCERKSGSAAHTHRRGHGNSPPDSGLRGIAFRPVLLKPAGFVEAVGCQEELGSVGRLLPGSARSRPSKVWLRESRIPAAGLGDDHDWPPSSNDDAFGHGPWSRFAVQRPSILPAGGSFQIARSDGPISADPTRKSRSAFPGSLTGRS